MATGKYILAGHSAVECHDLLEWGQWIETADRRVAKTQSPTLCL